MLTQKIIGPNFVMKKNIIENKVNIIANKVAVFTNARNECHIKEWAAHHILIGFDHIIIFDHKSNTPIERDFVNFDKKVKVINVSHMENPVKITLMNDAIQISKKLNIDWFIYLDSDEFIILHKKFKGVKDFLNLYNQADSLGVNWLMFGSNYLTKEPDGLILESYTRSELCLNNHVKSFVRPNKIINSVNPHYYNMINPNRCFDTNNNIMKDNYAMNNNTIEYFNSSAYIAHYVYQSEESFKNRKILLPRDDNGLFRNENINNVSYIHKYYNNIENNSPKNKYANKIKEFLSKYNNS